MSELVKQISEDLALIKEQCDKLMEENRRYRFLLGLDETPFKNTPNFLTKMETKNGRGE